MSGVGPLSMSCQKTQTNKQTNQLTQNYKRPNITSEFGSHPSTSRSPDSAFHPPHQGDFVDNSCVLVSFLQNAKHEHGRNRIHVRHSKPGPVQSDFAKLRLVFLPSCQDHKKCFSSNWSVAIQVIPILGITSPTWVISKAIEPQKRLCQISKKVCIP